MSKQHRTRLVRVGEYIAEVDIELIHSEEGWAPYLSVEDAQKLDTVRQALEVDDIRAAGKYARVYRLTSVNV